MNRARGIALAAVAALLAVAGIAGAVSPTQASWTDRTHATASVTAGTWTTPTAANTCVAWADAAKKQPTSCTIGQITASPWGNGPRDYQVYWSTGVKPYWVEFTVDLSTATLKNGVKEDPAWSWTGATVRASGAQFTPVRPGIL